MSVRKLAEEMRGRYMHLRGSSYGGIRQYVEGKIESPRVDLLEAIADVLGVRPEWLTFNDGPMTKRQEQAQKVRKRTKAQEERGEFEPWQERYDSMLVGMKRPLPLWGVAGYFYATEPLVQGLVVDVLESGGEDLLKWSPEDVEEVTYWLMKLIAAPARDLRPGGPELVGRVMEKWPEYFAAMTMAIRAALPPEGQGRPREILARHRANEKFERWLVPTTSSPRDHGNEH